MPSPYQNTPVYSTGRLKVSEIHEIYYEQAGKEDGLPIVFLHGQEQFLSGGPGGCITDQSRIFFDPAVYRIVLFDQRGAGKSTPHASLVDNTTWDLVGDIEKLRNHLGIERWVVFGGSWGSTLALAYAETHPDRCLGLILRGIFCLRRCETEWFYQAGADMLFPEYFEDFRSVIPESEQNDLMAAYYKRLTGDDNQERLTCAAAWSRWEMSTYKLIVDPEAVRKATDDAEWALAFARIECHYFVNGGWMEEGQLLTNAHRIKHLPISITQGRYDVVCPSKTAWELYQALGGEKNKNVEYNVADASGHFHTEEQIMNKLVETCDRFRSLER